MPAYTVELPGDRVTEDPVERAMYARDLAPVPDVMVKYFFKTLPDLVVRPGNTAQVSQVMRQAAQQRIPVTPRAAASTSYYNAVPVRGGIALDVNSLRNGIDLDASRQVAHVLPATTWFELDDALQQQGFAVKSYPSSAISATVGGWVNTQGYGIGSLQYGGLGEHLISLEVVLPDGQVRVVTRDTDPPLDWFVASEGTLGVVTHVELAVRPLPASATQHLVATDNLPALGADILALSQGDPRPYTLFFADAGYLSLLQRSGFHVPLDPASGQALLLIRYEGEPLAVARGKDALAGLQSRELAAELALDEWNLRLFHLRTKRTGPSLLAAEMWLPLANLAGYLAAAASLAARSRQVIGSYGLVVSPEQAQVMSIYPADERHAASYLAAIGFTKRLYDLGARFGGKPYGVGLWNTAYLGRLFSRKQLCELRRRKAQLDPLGIMNPGKLTAASFPLWPISFAPGAWALGTAHMLRGRIA